MESFLNTQPIYLQIIDMIKRKIATAALQPGQPFQPVRELAMELKVNPNTVQRALSELEREGYVRSERTIGRYVTNDQALIAELHTILFKEATDHYLAVVKQLNVKDDEVIATVKHRLKGVHHD
jgi:DNA-binding transcriptional regulator YhcF (GntR family)